jgi:hypothetical protein
MNGLFFATYRWVDGGITLFESTSPVILVNSGVDRFQYVEADGDVAGTLRTTSTTFSITFVEQEQIGTGTYSYSAPVSGAVTADSFIGSGTAEVSLVSGIDSEGLDGITLDVEVSASREGQTPSGTSQNLAGDYLAQFTVINAPPDFEIEFGADLELSARGGGIYDVTDNDPDGASEWTLVAIGSTWYMVSEDYFVEEGTEYSETDIFSGTLDANSFEGAGLVVFLSEDGTDNAGLAGLELQVSLEAARIS